MSTFYTSVSSIALSWVHKPLSYLISKTEKEKEQTGSRKLLRGMRCCPTLIKSSTAPGWEPWALHIFAFEKWPFTLSNQAAHLIKGKHIYHLVKGSLHQHLKAVFVDKNLSKSLRQTDRRMLWQTLEASNLSIVKQQSNSIHYAYLRRPHWCFLLAYCGYWILLMCLPELTR